ncbi:LexA family transcriptional regulator [Fibrisoma montanum]|uniref:LexA family transcriptional regulator n=1 Tax=Fibrisoma montanum TaxID=2305895 RepID=A0A418MBA8_9BACT|nr:LexA family transcriptional regulator [Fibrisoma montanum]RIV23649.1 LexA family transcriptional regulator [Fibrisoma montanum]
MLDYVSAIEEMSLGAKLKALRESKKLTQQHVAEHLKGLNLGKSKQMISLYESNTNIPPISVLASLAKLYETSLDDLIEERNGALQAQEHKPLYKIADYKRVEDSYKHNVQADSNLIYEKSSYIPFYDVEVTAGKIEVFFDESDNPAGYIYAPEFAGCIACKVWGDSMYDRILPGATVFIYPIESKKYFDYGQIYMVAYPGHRVLKYIQPCEGDESKVMLVSENKRQPPYPVEKNDIQRVFLVKGYWNQTTN